MTRALGKRTTRQVESTRAAGAAYLRQADADGRALPRPENEAGIRAQGIESLRRAAAHVGQSTVDTGATRIKALATNVHAATVRREYTEGVARREVEASAAKRVKALKPKPAPKPAPSTERVRAYFSRGGQRESVEAPPAPKAKKAKKAKR